MRQILVLFAVLFFTQFVDAESIIPDTTVTHAWAKGVYWNPDRYPGWGFFVDVQEETFFGAIYGYQGSDSTFITMQGKLYQLDPLQFRGDVYFITNGGGTATDVGNFTWSVRYSDATPAATISISSNILNVTNLQLVRFVYSEIDNIDILTGADWNLIEKILTMWGDSYAISDERYVDDGKTYVMVVNNIDPDDIGVAAYYPPDEGEMFAMLVPLDENTNNFFIFFASDTNMYGRYWLLDEGESPTGSGYYFHGSIAAMQEENNDAGVGTGSPTGTDSATTESTASSHQIEIASGESESSKKDAYKNSSSDLEPIVSEEVALRMYDQLSKVREERFGNLLQSD